MKYFFFAIILFAFSCRIPKTLDGNYYETFDSPGGGATYTFHKDGSFEYAALYDVGGVAGKGKYSLMNHRMKFTFSGDSLPIQPSKIETTEYDLQNNWELNISVFDDSVTNPLPFAMIIVSDSLGKILAGKQSDLDGKATISIGGYSGTIALTIKSIGAFTTIKLDRRGKYSIIANMIFHYNAETITKGTIWKYRIVYFSQDGINMKKKERHVNSNVGNKIIQLEKSYK